jgi:hypothetical protein
MFKLAILIRLNPWLLIQLTCLIYSYENNTTHEKNAPTMYWLLQVSLVLVLVVK